MATSTLVRPVLTWFEVTDLAVTLRFGVDPSGVIAAASELARHWVGKGYAIAARHYARLGLPLCPA